MSWITVSAARDAANKVKSIELPANRFGREVDRSSILRLSCSDLVILATSMADSTSGFVMLRSPRPNQAEQRAARNRASMVDFKRRESDALNCRRVAIHLSSMCNGICRKVYPPTTAPQKKGNPWNARER